MKHQATCTNITKACFNQKKIKKQNAFELAVQYNFIRADQYKQDFVTIDLEAANVNMDHYQVTEKSIIHGEQDIVTAAVTRSWDEGEKTKTFIRGAMTEERYFSMMHEILSYLSDLQKQLFNRMEDNIKVSINFLDEALEKDKTQKDLSVEKRWHYKTILDYLKKYDQLYVYSFNGARYDHHLMWPGIVNAVVNARADAPLDNDISPKDLKEATKDFYFIRKGSGLTAITMGKITFRDAIALTSPTNLIDFCATWGVKEKKKGVFPYERFSSSDSMKEYTEFPPVKDFVSSLTSSREFIYDKDEYNTIVNEFKAKAPTADYDYIFYSPIPNDDDGKILSPVDLKAYSINYHFFYEKKKNKCDYNFLDFCIYYNGQDTEMLTEALQNYNKEFRTKLNVNPLDYMGIPGIAENILYQYWDATHGHAVSFGKKHEDIFQLFSDACVGGLTAIYGKRHIECGKDVPPGYDASVYRGDNGERYNLCILLDHNSLYPYSMAQNLPAGAGFRIDKIDDVFSCRSMDEINTQWSVDAMNWLNEKWHQINNINGSTAIMIHALNEGEKRIKLEDRFSYYVDGYMEVNGDKYVFEYNGCYFHECEEPYCSVVPSSHAKTKKYERTRSSFFRQKGYIYEMMSECRWKRRRQTTITRPHMLTNFFNRNDIKEEEIFNDIDEGNFYGLIKCDLHSPPSLIEKFKSVNFAPVIQHIEIEESMVNENLLETMKERGIKFPLPRQLTVTFHGKGMFITTTLLKFYKKIGMEISNITQAIQYPKAKPLEKFVKTVTENRINATTTSESNTWKLVANSSYGRLGMNRSKFVNRFISAEGHPLKHPGYIKQCHDIPPTNFIEVVKDKKKYEEVTPIHLATTILLNSKEKILKTVWTMIEYWDTTAFDIIYSGVLCI